MLETEAVMDTVTTQHADGQGVISDADFIQMDANAQMVLMELSIAEAHLPEARAAHPMGYGPFQQALMRAREYLARLRRQHELAIGGP